MVVCIFCIPSIGFAGALENTCSETDDGNDLHTRGITTVTDSSGSKEHIDRCKIGSSMNLLEEFYCDSRGRMKSVFIECKHYCIEGRCVDAEEATELLDCTESDSGKNPFMNGSTEGRISTTTPIGTFHDICISESVLTEYYCEDGFVRMEAIVCSNCSDAHCLYDAPPCENQTFRYTSCKETKTQNVSSDITGCNDIYDHACCSSLECVLDGRCYATNTSIKKDHHTILCREGYWTDCDTSNATCRSCGLNWTILGEGFFIGEYEKELKECCGDDQGESFIAGLDNTSACCDDPKDIVIDGICYSNQKKESVERNITAFRDVLISHIKNDAEHDTNEDTLNSIGPNTSTKQEDSAKNASLSSPKTLSSDEDISASSQRDKQTIINKTESTQDSTIFQAIWRFFKRFL